VFGIELKGGLPKALLEMDGPGSIEKASGRLLRLAVHFEAITGRPLAAVART
jgi:hypothetical protein